MKGLRHILVGTAVALSLGLSIAMARLWIRSNSHSDQVISTRTTVEQVAKGWTQISLSSLEFHSMHGQCMIQWRRNWATVDDDQAKSLGRHSERFLAHDWDLNHLTYSWVGAQKRSSRWPHWFYFYRERQLRPKDPVQWYVVFPHAAAVVVFAVPAMLLGRSRLRRKRRRGVCAACGYDLRATPEQCPECGAVAGSGRVAISDTPSP
jgi:hypothetical protein